MVDNPYFFPATDSTYSAGHCKGISILQYTSVQAMSALIKSDLKMKPKEVADLAVDYAEAIQKRWEKK